MNQLSCFEDIDVKQMRRLVVKELKDYKALCVQMKIKKNRLERGGHRSFSHLRYFKSEKNRNKDNF
ncbi:hypothetical protein F8160_03600 [Bacillus sp. CH126_4D]|nr:hypothetical protein F8162_22645 [Bacillus sp. CH140a_4T]KAB2474743.1 hypothetical protein F8160_03600 [Bacillus sp. CH126_4D]